jgi:hypothetical protein
MKRKSKPSMLLEWIRRNDEAFAKKLKDYLFREGKEITKIEEANRSET